MRVQTQSVHFVADRKLLQFIDKKVNKLETFYDRIIDADVTLRLENTGKVKDKIAEIKLQVPGDTLIVRETSKTFEGSVDSAVGNFNLYFDFNSFLRISTSQKKSVFDEKTDFFLCAGNEIAEMYVMKIQFGIKFQFDDIF